MATYADETEALSAGLAKDYRLEVSKSDDPALPEWIRVRAISEFSPGIDSNMEDSSDFDSNGWQSSTKTAQGWSLEVKVMRKVGRVSGAFDEGQEILRIKADKFGPEGEAHIRYFSTNQNGPAYEGFVSVVYEPEGGSVTDLDAATFTLTGQGERKELTEHPLADA